MAAVQVVAGFSLTNRLLLYTSILLAPAQFMSGTGNNCPSNLGFLAYNWYTQIQWYQATKAKQLHALSLLIQHFNLIYTISYLGGITSGNIVMGILLGLGTAGVMITNTLAAWTSWATNQPDGFGIYQFFFFGWRTLSPDWHTFFLCWQIFDSLATILNVVAAIVISIQTAEQKDGGVNKVEKYFRTIIWIPYGAAIMLLGSWPLILWTELIVARNNIESDTDMIAVYLFIAQAVAMLVPDFGCLKFED